MSGHRSFVINKLGEEIVCHYYNGQEDFVVKDMNHAWCGGCVTRHRIAEKIDSLHCGSCSRIATLPRDKRKFKEIEEYFQRKIDASEESEARTPSDLPAEPPLAAAS